MANQPPTEGQQTEPSVSHPPNTFAPLQRFQGPLKHLAQRAINLRTMNPLLRVITISTFIFLIVSAALLGTVALQPTIVLGSVGNTLFHLPLGVAIGIIALFIIGYGYIIAGALQVQWWARLLIMVIVTYILSRVPLSELQLGNIATLAGRSAAIGQLVVIGMLDLWAVIVSFFKADAQRNKRPERTIAVGITFWGSMGLCLLYLGLAIVGYLLNASDLPNNGGVVSFSLIFLYQLIVLAVLLNFFTLWASTDFIEWGETVARGLIAGAQRFKAPWLVALLPILASLGIIIDTTRLTWGTHDIAPLIGTVVMVFLILGAILLARIDQRWKPEDAAPTLFVGAAYLFGEYILPFFVIDSLQLHDANALRSQIFIKALVDVIALGTSLVLLVARRGPALPRARTIGLFLLLVLIINLPNLTQDLKDATGATVPVWPILDYPTLRGVIALGALIFVVALLLRRKAQENITLQLANVFLLLVGLQSIIWFYDYSNRPSQSAAFPIEITAAFFLGSVVWDLLFSGEQVTNRDSTAFPRAGRLFLHLGYAIIGAALFVLAGTLQPTSFATATGSFTLANLNSLIFPIGLFYLGIPFVLFNFATRIGSQRLAPAESNEQVRRGLSAVQWGLASLALVAIVLSGTLALTRPLPQQSQASATPTPQPTPVPQPYTAVIPGPQCDHNGGTWVANVAGQCQNNALDLPLVHFTSGYAVTLGFIPPSNTLVSNYQMSIHVDLTKLKGTARQNCIVLTMREEGSASYQDVLCQNGVWGLELVQGTSSSDLADGTLPTTFTSGTVTAFAQGTEQRLSLNGAILADVHDGTLATTTSITISAVSQNGGDVLLSNFAYTPLS